MPVIAANIQVTCRCSVSALSSHLGRPLRSVPSPPATSAERTLLAAYRSLPGLQGSAARLCLRIVQLAGSQRPLRFVRDYRSWQPSRWGVTIVVRRMARVTATRSAMLERNLDGAALRTCLKVYCFVPRSAPRDSCPSVRWASQTPIECSGNAAEAGIATLVGNHLLRVNRHHRATAQRRQARRRAVDDKP